MFFDQIKDLDNNLKDLKEHLNKIGSSVDVHFDQLDDIAAHIIALEAMMVQVVKTVDIDVEAAKEWVRSNTEVSTGHEGGSEKAKIVIDELTGKSDA